MKHTDLVKNYSNFVESFAEVENENFDLESREISEAIYKHIFQIKSSLWKQGVEFNRRKRISVSEIFQDLVALYIKLGLNSSDFEVILEESCSRLQPDILIKYKEKNLFIVEVKTNLGWKRDSIETVMGERIKKLSLAFNIPFNNVVYIFQNPWNMSKAFTQKFWNQEKKEAMSLPTEFPFNRIRPLLTAEDPFYSIEGKVMRKKAEFADLTYKIDENIESGIVIPLEKTIQDILTAAKKSDLD